MNREQLLAKILRHTARDRELAGVVVRIERPSEHFSWAEAVGELEVESRFFIASVTKLFTTAALLQLVDRGTIQLETAVVNVLDPELLRGLHVISGVDRTAEITLRHLLAHTSGLPDYFMAKSSRRHAGPRSLEKMVRGGNDVHWSFDDVLGWARTAGAVFPPGAGRKAVYSDTNFQLLGKVIEAVARQPYGEVLQQGIFAPLGLRHTWLYDDPGDSRPVALRDGPKQLHIPKAMTSFGPDGGVVSTAEELMRFLRAFFAGELFAQGLLEQLDTPGMIAKIKIFPVNNGDAANLVETLRSLIPSQTGAANDLQLSSAPGETS